MGILALKTETFYTACSPEHGLVCFGQCWEEAVNRLQEEVQARAEIPGEENDGQ